MIVLDKKNLGRDEVPI